MAARRRKDGRVLIPVQASASVSVPSSLLSFCSLLLLIGMIIVDDIVVPPVRAFQQKHSILRPTTASTTTTILSSPTLDNTNVDIAATDQEDTTTKSSIITEKKKKKKIKPLYIKNEREKIAKSKDFYRGAGVFRKVKADVTEDMRRQFDSELMTAMKDTPNYMVERDGVEFYLAKDHGFCWGVERSINLAYSAVETFPQSTVHITNELIHNPMVNERLHNKNVNFIQKIDDTSVDQSNPNAKDFSMIKEGDVVMLPAFGATLDEMKELDSKNVKVVDTTCPWVAKVWNTVHTHQVRGLTSVIHGKYAHEETMATKSMCETYVCVKNIDEAQIVSDFILNDSHKDENSPEGIEAKQKFTTKFKAAASVHFNPFKHLKKIGLANQTTMYKKETRAIGQLLQKTMMKTFGPDLLNEHYYEFDTICDATQVRQDAVDELCTMHFDPDQPDLDFILVVGGFDSSNTAHLLEIPHMRKVPSFHINTADCITASNTITHRDVDGTVIEDQSPFLTDAMVWADGGADAHGGKRPRTKKLLRVGVTSGASTPDKEVQDALGRIMMINNLLEEQELVKQQQHSPSSSKEEEEVEFVVGKGQEVEELQPHAVRGVVEDVVNLRVDQME